MSHTPTWKGPVYLGSVRDSRAPNGDRRGISCIFGGSGSASIVVVPIRVGDDERRRPGNWWREGENSGFEPDASRFMGKAVFGELCGMAVGEVVAVKQRVVGGG